jgi:MFS family permease
VSETTTRAAGPGAPPRAATRARVAVTVMFVIHGLLFASWTAHIPQVKAHLHLTDGALGLALLGAPVGSVAAMLGTGALLSRAGSRAVVRISAAGYCLTGCLAGMADSLPWLFAALAAWGVFQGVLDVAMNTQGITVERALGRPIMPVLHGGWSVGSLAGAAAGILGVATGTGLTAQLLLLGLPAVAVATWMSPRLLTDPRPERAAGAGRTRMTGVLAILGMIAFAGLLCEGATADWAAVYLRDELHTTAAVSGLGYAAFALAMVAVRLSGGRLLALAGPRRLLGVLAGVATAGMTAGLLSGVPVIAIVGFGLLGVGLASIIPTLFSAAGNQPGIAPGTAVATVSAIGWAGFMCGPPLIGFAAEQTSRTVALGVFPLLTAFIAVVSARASALDRATM